MMDIMLLKAINYKMPQDAKIKQRLKEEGSQLVTNCHQLKRRLCYQRTHNYKPNSIIILQ